MVVKSLEAEEAETLARQAPKYASYFESREGRHSLINRFFGCFRMKLYGQTVHFVVLSSVTAAARAVHGAPVAPR